METPVIIRSSRKTVSLEIAPSGDIIVRAPMRMPNKEIEAFIAKNQKWISDHKEKMRLRQQMLESVEPFSIAEIEEMAKKAIEIIPDRVKFYAAKIGVTYGRITIRNQRTKWGSCSEKGNLNFNCLLMAAPPEVLDSVVVHELCHRIHMNHSKAFYAEVYHVFPEYDKWDKWLKDNGNILMQRMIAGMRISSEGSK